ncbi:MAG TPA: M56 family metallopeptidase [Gemmatimonadaceae bacterium]|nr:M56 family metallopeptidase [Gemmatimonadaceae bacterium]
MSGIYFLETLMRSDAAATVVKATVVLALADVVAILARRASAARRHLIWLVALCSCAWLVLSSPVAPPVVIRTPLVFSAALSPAASTSVDPQNDQPSARVAYPPAARGPRPQVSTERVSARAGHRLSVFMSGNAFMIIWIVGCAGLLLRTAIAYAGARRIVRRGQADASPELRDLMACASRACALRRPITVRRSVHAATPLTFGFMKPVVLLPADAGAWPVERVRVVFLHEAAHVARNDWLSQSIGRFACALLWFHPLVWRALGQLRDEAERAADDCVLASGTAPVDYASHLLELARRTTVAIPAGIAVGIVGSTNLERRFIAMLDNSRSRATVTSRTRGLATSVAVLLSFPFASLRLGAHTAPRVQPASHRTESAAVATPAISVHMTTTRASRPRPSTATPNVTSHASTVAPPKRRIAWPAMPHPDLSGKWVGVVTEPPWPDDDVLDSCLIMQTQHSFTLLSYGTTHRGMPRLAEIRNLPLDGTPGPSVFKVPGFAASGTESAVWEGDTLVLSSHLQADGVVVHAIERMRLSPDGKTVSTVTRNWNDGQDVWGRSRTFVMRRVDR